MAWYIWVTSLICLGMAIIYALLKQRFSYWSSRGVHYLNPSLIFGNIKERIFMRVPYHDFQKNLYFEFDGYPYAGVYEGSAPNLMVRDPELIKCILVKDFDHFVDRIQPFFKSNGLTSKMLIMLSKGEWKQVRAAITPTFSSAKMKAMFNLVTHCGEQLSDFINKNIQNKGDSSMGDVEMKDLLSKFTLDVIASCAFAIESNSFNETDSEFFKHTSKFNDIPLFKRIILFAVIICRFPKFITQFLPLSFFNEETLHFLVDAVKQTIKHRRANNFRRNDFLQLLIDASTAEDNEISTNERHKTTSKKVLEEEVVIAECVLFLIAGYETSSSVLATCCYQLALEPEIQEKLRSEVTQVLKKHNGVLTYEALSEMTYMDMVIAETLRMYSPVARLDRTCTKEYNLGGELLLEEGLRINIPVHGLHYDPLYYPDPFKFDPERFTQENKASRHPFVYLPFGYGPRNCIGLRFAQMTTKVCMVNLMKDYLIKTSTKTEVPLVYHKRSMLLKSANGIWLNITKTSPDYASEIHPVAGDN